MNAIDIGSKV